MNTQVSVLETPYVEPERPFSQKELENMRSQLYAKLYLGSMVIKHKDCGHFYVAKKNGKKEKEAMEKGEENVGNCSVCWKLNKTPKRLRKLAHSTVDEFCENMPTQTELSYGMIDMERVFYTWLYREFNPEQK
jgi:hypothetical protein